jgi:hypothetical protein
MEVSEGVSLVLLGHVSVPIVNVLPSIGGSRPSLKGSRPSLGGSGRRQCRECPPISRGRSPIARGPSPIARGPSPIARGPGGVPRCRAGWQDSHCLPNGWSGPLREPYVRYSGLSEVSPAKPSPVTGYRPRLSRGSLQLDQIISPINKGD